MKDDYMECEICDVQFSDRSYSFCPYCGTELTLIRTRPDDMDVAQEAENL